MRLGMLLALHAAIACIKKAQDALQGILSNDRIKK